MNIISQRIKQRREELGFTRAYLAELAGCSAQMVTRYEQGSTMSIDMAIGVSSALGVTIDWLIHGGDDVLSENTVQRIPIVGTIDTGADPAWLSNWRNLTGEKEWVNFSGIQERLYSLKVNSNKYSPRICLGEAIIVEPTGKPIPGEDVFVRFKAGGVDIKTLASIRNTTVYLEHCIESHQRITCDMSEIDYMHPIVANIRSTRINRK